MTLSLGMASCILPGGGGSEQIVPQVILAGQPATFQLVVSAVDVPWVWGRYRNLNLFYRLVSDSSYRQTHPSRQYAVDRAREGFEFVVPPYPTGTRDSLEFYFTFRFDGHPNTARGYKRIPVE